MRKRLSICRVTPQILPTVKAMSEKLHVGCPYMFQALETSSSAP